MMSRVYERVNKVLRRVVVVVFSFFSPLIIPYFVMVFLGGGGRTSDDGYMGPSIPKGQRISSHPG
jgi:hypothetical protein